MNGNDFVDRIPELKIIEDIINPAKNWGSRKIICISGDAGVGKTRLLQEIQELYSQKVSFLVISTLDFDDTELQFDNRIKAEIASIAPEVFKPFIEINQGLLEVERPKWGEMAYETFARKAGEEFINCFNSLSKTKRILISYDTTEELGNIELWRGIAEYLPQLQNVVMLVAGRNANEISMLLSKILPQDVTHIPLQTLSTESAIKFLRKKEEESHIILQPTLRKKMALLIGGYPILLNLAIKWHASNRIPEWVKNTGIKGLEILVGGEDQSKRNEFINLLIGTVAQFRSRRDQLIVLLSHVYPVEEEAIPVLLECSPQEAYDLINELVELMLVKRLPKSRVKLSDHVQVLIEEVVGRLEKKRGSSEYSYICLRYLSYLYNVIQDTRQEIKQLSKNIIALEGQGLSAQLLRLKREEKQRYLLGYLEDQAIIHETDLDPSQAFRHLTQLLREVDNYYNPSFRKRLVSTLGKRRLSLSQNLRIRLDLERCDTDIQVNDLESALEIVNDELFKNVQNRPQYHARTLYLKGHALIRLGRVKEAIQAFDDAIQISKEKNLNKLHVRSEEALGSVYSTTANWNEARKHYLEAIQRNIILGDTKRESSLLTSLAFCQSFTGIEGALAIITKAKESLQRDDKQGFGRAYFTEGCILYHSGQYSKALDYFRMAMDIFGPAGDIEWKSLVLSWRGANYWALALEGKQTSNDLTVTKDLSNADEDLENSLAIGLRRDRPMTLHRLARVRFEQGKIEEAQMLFEECYRISQSISVPLYELATLRELANIAILRKDFGSFDGFENKFKAFIGEHGEWRNHTDGGMRIFLGLLGFGNPEVNPIKSIAYLEEGLDYVSTGHTYSPNGFGYYINMIDAYIRKTGTQETIRGLGGRLLKFWIAKPDLIALHPDAIVYFMKWTVIAVS